MVITPDTYFIKGDVANYNHTETFIFVSVEI